MVVNRKLKEIHTKSLKGDKEALNEMTDIFRRQLYKHSYINGRFNEDCFQELNIKLIEGIKRFRFDKEFDIFKPA